MTSGQKTALSVLISVILFGAFVVASFAGLFSAIDARFYEPTKISQIKGKLDGVASAYDEYLKTLSERFALGESAFLKNAAVQTFVEAKPSEKDAVERGEILGELRSSTQGLLGFRVLDKNQNSIHYSTFRSDILRRDEKNNLTAYKNYLDCLSPAGNEEIPAQRVAASDTGGDLAAGQKIYYDAENRIVVSFPLYDKYSVFRGSAIFYVNALDFSNVLLRKNLISIGEGVSFLSNGMDGADSLSGFVLGLPSVGAEEFKEGLLDAWKKNSGAAERILSIDSQSKNFWVALSQRSASGVFACGVYNDEIFALPSSARALILVCAFISLFLISFLLLNLRRDDETVIRERIKSLQLGVVDEYLSKKEALNWETISGRREAVTKEIIQSLGSRAKKRPAQVEELINRSWDELFAAMNLRPNGSKDGGGLENAQEIKAMLQEILSSGAIKVQAVAPSAPASAAPARPVAAPAPAEPVEDLEEVEAAEEIEEVEEAEPVEDLEEVEEAEEVAEAEPVEDLEEVEEVEEAEPVEDLEEVEEIEEVADAEPVEDLEEVEEVEELEEVAPLETVDENEKVAPAVQESPLEAQPVEDLEEVEEVEELEEVAPLETVDENEKVAPAVQESPLEAQPVEDLEEVEEVEDLEEVAPAEPVEEPASDDDLHDLASELSSFGQHTAGRHRTEVYDVSEDVAHDFFAKKDESEEKKHSAAQKGASENDPFYNVRDSFAPNEETEELVNKFSIDGLDYKELDVGNDDQKINGTLEEEKSESVKELTPEDFGISNEEEKKAFAEPIEFGAPQNQDEDDGFDVASTFTTEKPHFDRNPAKAFANASQPSSEQSDSEPEQNAAAAIPVSSKENFMFSSFGQDSSFSELQTADYSAIVEDDDGVFSIAGDVQTGGVVQDNSFKRLVESVLNKD